MPDETCEVPSDQTTPGPPESTAGPPNGLVLVSTPIGNLQDLSPRAVAALRAADTVLCEDTRVTARLCAAFGVGGRLLALHEHNEDARIPQVLRLLAAGRRVALVSDAGTPLVSDPGYRLVRAAIAAGLEVHGVPGANAATLALVLSGLPPQPFLFMGFLPPRQAARRAVLAGLRAAEQAGLSATIVLYEAPHRAGETLADLAEILGHRPAALARELTKKFEEVVRAPLPDLAARYAEVPPRGEVTLVIGPPDPAAQAEVDLDGLLRAALAGASLKQAVAQVTAATGLPRKQVYARALALAT